MATVVLVRHGRTTANASGTLAGRLPDVHLDDRGREQAAVAAARLAELPLVELVSSPLERCRETTAMLTEGREVPITYDESVTECDYGQWQGGRLKDLAKEDLWKVVQTHPSAAAFPGGESLPAMQARAVAAVRRHDARLHEHHGDAAVWALVSHGDILKSILADALGMHLDLFQRLSVHPASISVIRYGTTRPDVLAMNTVAGDLSWLAGSSGGETVGGGGGAPSAGS